ncbi:MAG TPA: hypothetical protein DEF41_00035 [Desulfovibrio sp.]|uniref:Uncharacterized protein n=1 Tax=Nitratidesulfovibrio vulgaris (strain ATCC 29579 / DSM 644 / CCUG 34227 / NCIMB 8303 / VKM B-1760 / Hildenborough) TaxID=882 RepID=Q72EE8_NITV2|nr:hypothetical protein DVU_0630 [Nitratidesulfovibrio vulgaris str. Hildenborough]HBW14549.1 hypothetical protein [Desulfovibrio sp.]
MPLPSAPIHQCSVMTRRVSVATCFRCRRFSGLYDRSSFAGLCHAKDDGTPRASFPIVA